MPRGRRGPTSISDTTGEPIANPARCTGRRLADGQGRCRPPLSPPARPAARREHCAGAPGPHTGRATCGRCFGSSIDPEERISWLLLPSFPLHRSCPSASPAAGAARSEGMSTARARGRLQESSQPRPSPRCRGASKCCPACRTQRVGRDRYRLIGFASAAGEDRSRCRTVFLGLTESEPAHWRPRRLTGSVLPDRPPPHSAACSRVSAPRRRAKRRSFSSSKRAIAASFTGPKPRMRCGRAASSTATS